MNYVRYNLYFRNHKLQIKMTTTQNPFSLFQNTQPASSWNNSTTWNQPQKDPMSSPFQFTATPATSIFNTQPTTPASVFNAQPTSTPVVPPTTAQTPVPTQNDKSQVLNTLNESKNIQLEILNVLKNINTLAQNQNQNQTQNQNQNQTVHESIHCNICNKNNIQGVRYKCLFCNDFDLCQDCEVNSVNNHDNSHVFLKIKDTKIFNNSISTKKIFEYR